MQYTDTEFEFEYGDPEAEFEISEEMEFDQENPLNEAEEMELAAQLLEITDEAELDQFLGGLFKKVWKGVKKIGKPLGGMLKKVAKVALPLAGTAAGSFFGGPLGGMIGGKVASGAGKLFGLELEGMSSEDQEFEVARRFVRFAASAARRAGRTPAGANPYRAARRAMAIAARRHAPGLLRRRRRSYPRYRRVPVYTPAYYPPPEPAPIFAADEPVEEPPPPDDAAADAPTEELYGLPRPRKGMWTRYGNTIVLNYR